MPTFIDEWNPILPHILVSRFDAVGEVYSLPLEDVFLISVKV